MSSLIALEKRMIDEEEEDNELMKTLYMSSLKIYLREIFAR